MMMRDRVGTKARRRAVTPGRGATARRTRGRVVAVTLLAVQLVIAGCGGDAPEPCPPLFAGVERVEITGPGTWQAAGVAPRLVELWRAGGLEEGQELGFPVEVAASAGHWVALPDFMLNELILVGPDGEWRQRVLRSGRGPGELASAIAAGWDAAGRLAVFDVINAKIVVLDASGAVSEELPLPLSFTAPIVGSGGLVQAGVHPSGAGFIQPIWTAAMGAPTDVAQATFLHVVPGATAADTLLSVRFGAAGHGSGRWPLPGEAMPWAALGPDGGVTVVGLSPDYAVLQMDAAGQPQRQLCRTDAAPLPWTDQERGLAAAPAGWEALEPEIRAARLPALPPATGRVFVGADGRTWVQRERGPVYPGIDGMYGVAGAEWDVFAADGAFQGTLRAPAGARLQAANAERVWAFAVGELEETYLVAYRIEMQPQ